MSIISSISLSGRADEFSFRHNTCFSPWKVFKNGNVPSPQNPADPTDDELYNLLVEHENNPVDDFDIFPKATVHKFSAADEVPNSARLTESNFAFLFFC